MDLTSDLLSLCTSSDFYSMLADDTEWKSLYIDYEHPVVERLWREWGSGRLYLHRIHPCEKALLHPHPWPSVVMIVDGMYEMGVGYGAGKEEPPMASKLILTPGSIYEMSELDAWHYVKPESVVHSIMLTGRAWKREYLSKPDKPLGPLTDLAKGQILTFFLERYRWIDEHAELRGKARR